jgi:hypothetical protein
MLQTRDGRRDLVVRSGVVGTGPSSSRRDGHPAWHLNGTRFAWNFLVEATGFEHTNLPTAAQLLALARMIAGLTRAQLQEFGSVGGS